MVYGRSIKKILDYLSTLKRNIITFFSTYDVEKQQYSSKEAYDAIKEQLTETGTEIKKLIPDISVVKPFIERVLKTLIISPTYTVYYTDGKRQDFPTLRDAKKKVSSSKGSIAIILQQHTGNIYDISTLDSLTDQKLTQQQQKNKKKIVQHAMTEIQAQLNTDDVIQKFIQYINDYYKLSEIRRINQRQHTGKKDMPTPFHESLLHQVVNDDDDASSTTSDDFKSARQDEDGSSTISDYSDFVSARGPDSFSTLDEGGSVARSIVIFVLCVLFL